MRIGRWIFYAIVIFWFVFMMLPMVIVVITSFTSESYLRFPTVRFFPALVRRGATAWVVSQCAGNQLMAGSSLHSHRRRSGCIWQRAC